MSENLCVASAANVCNVQYSKVDGLEVRTCCYSNPHSFLRPNSANWGWRSEMARLCACLFCCSLIAQPGHVV